MRPIRLRWAREGGKTAFPGGSASFNLAGSQGELVPAVRKPLLLVLSLCLVVMGLVGAIRLLGDRRGRTPQTVRPRMYADLRAGRLADCWAALTWLERHDRLTSEDWMVRARIEQLQGRPDQA